ncbi:MAG: hypothetical protein U9R36_03445, partial [Elusimicrobiota bacterium]|nr:hypothetical protein [Elusimicrobiota bacterium]
GTDEITNFDEEDLGPDRNPNDYNPDEIVEAKLTVVPFTVNFIYTLYENFYVGGGVGLYNVFYKEVPLGDYRVNPGQAEEEKGAEVKSPSSTSLGLQQVVGVEIFPMSENWSWFAGIKSFWIASAPTGSVLGVTIGGKARYSW